MNLVFKTPIILKVLAAGVISFTTAVGANVAGSTFAQSATVSDHITASSTMHSRSSIRPHRHSHKSHHHSRRWNHRTSGSFVSSPKYSLSSTTSVPTQTTMLNATGSNSSSAIVSLQSPTIATDAPMLHLPISRPPTTIVYSTTTQPAPVTTTTHVVPSTTTTQPAPVTTTTQVVPPTTTTQPAPTSNLLNFNGFTENVNAAPGSNYGDWSVLFNGYGSVMRTSDPILGDVLNLAPKASTSPGETHSALVTSTSNFSNFNATYTYRTVSQLRSGSSPNPWEVGWVLFHYTDNTHFYYFIAKPTGWELGKEDPSYPGNQRFLATGSSPAFPVGNTYHVNVQMTGATITVTVNGTPIVSYTDNQNPYPSGSLGLYTEDSSVSYAPVTVN